MSLSDYERMLLDGWEDVHKKSQLTFWVLLSLKDGSKHMAQIKHFISVKTNNLLEADDKSMYRALRRFQDADMISNVLKNNPNGPDQKVFSLTETGESVLAEFIKRNIVDILFRTDIKKLLEC